jgi:hypothetical protein
MTYPTHFIKILPIGSEVTKGGHTHTHTYTHGQTEWPPHKPHLLFELRGGPLK